VGGQLDPSPPDVAGEVALRVLRVAPGQRVEDQPVLVVDHLAPVRPAGKAHEGPAVGLRRVPQPHDAAGQLLASAPGVRPEVERPVQHEELGQVVVSHDLCVEVGQPGEVGAGQMRQRLGERQRLQPLSHPVQDVELGRVEARNPRTLVGGVLGEPLRLVDAQRLAHRQPAGSEQLGVLLLPDPLARCDPAGEDRLAQVRGDALAGGPGGRASCVGRVDGHGLEDAASTSGVRAAQASAVPPARSNALRPG
jgi:hypothetical protein